MESLFVTGWALTESDVESLASAQQNLWRLRILLLGAGVSEPHDLDEQLRVLDKIIGVRGAMCEVPQ